MTAADVVLPPPSPVAPADPSTGAPGGIARPRIAILGISIESSTFSPHRSGDEAFDVRTGDRLLQRYPFLAPGTALREAALWVPILQARSLPGGAVRAETYARLRAGILEGLAAEIARNGPLDGIFFDMHGAMSVEGMQDAEGDLCTAVRELVGPDVLTSGAFDLHGNVSRALADALDMLTCYRMAPHEDAWVTKHRAARNLVECLRGPWGRDPERRRPVLAWRQVPVLLPGEKTSTRLDPAASIYARVAEIEQRPGVLDASVWVGYAWADEPRCQAAVVVMGDDEAACAAGCEELARMWWEARDDFAFVGPTADLPTALARCAAEAPSARRTGERPMVLSDSGDNPTAGGAGDVTWTLAQLLASPQIAAAGLEVIHASVFDAIAVPRLADLGVGAAVDAEVGARVDAGPSGPVRVRGTITHVSSDDEVAGTQVVIACPVGEGTVHAILTERRKPFHHLADFTRLGLDPRAVDAVVVKIGYLEPELHELAARWLLVLTPGGVDQDLLRLGHAHLAPGVHPFAPRADEPDLRAVIVRHGV